MSANSNSSSSQRKGAFFVRRLKVVLRRWLRRILFQKDTPESIAAGTALGMFIALTPTVGLQMLIAVTLATLVRVNKVAAALLCWITNPLTIPPIYYGCYRLGLLIMPEYRLRDVGKKFDELANAESLKVYFVTITKLGVEVYVPMFVGSLVLGAIFGFLAYPVTLRAVKAYRERRAQWARRWKERRQEKEREREREEAVKSLPQSGPDRSAEVAVPTSETPASEGSDRA